MDIFCETFDFLSLFILVNISLFLFYVLLDNFYLLF